MLPQVHRDTAGEIIDAFFYKDMPEGNVLQNVLRPALPQTKSDAKQYVVRMKWCPGAESNHRHEDFQSTALPLSYPGMGKAVRLGCGPSMTSMRPCPEAFLKKHTNA